MAPEGSCKGKGKARVKMPTSVIYRCLLLDWESKKGFISEHIRWLIRIYNVCGVIDDRAWDLLYDIIFLDPVTTRHISQFQVMWQHCRSRSSPSREWWTAFRWYMRQMFEKTHDEMNNWRWDNLRTLGDQVNRSNPLTTISGRVDHTSEHFSWYGCDHLRARSEPPSCQQYKPGDLLAVGPLNWVKIINKDDDVENWMDPVAPRGGRSHLGDGNDNVDGQGEEDTQGGNKGTVK